MKNSSELPGKSASTASLQQAAGEILQQQQDKLQQAFELRYPRLVDVLSKSQYTFQMTVDNELVVEQMQFSSAFLIQEGEKEDGLILRIAQWELTIEDEQLEKPSFDMLVLGLWCMGLIRLVAAGINFSTVLGLFSAGYVLLAWLRWRGVPIRLLLLLLTVSEFTYLKLVELPGWSTQVLLSCVLTQVVYMGFTLMEATMDALGKQSR